MIISLALLQVEIVFLLILVVVFVVAGLLFVGAFISAVTRNPNRPGGGEGRERQERESEERGRGDRS